MRVLLAMLLLLPISASATIRALPPLSKAGLVGTWEAIVVRDGLPGAGVYMMRFDANGDGYLVHVLPFNEYGDRPHFFGRLAACQIEAGKIHLRFIRLPDEPDHYDSVLIDGYASGEGNQGGIIGTIKIRGAGREWTEPVCFNKGLWIHLLHDASKRADKFLRNVPATR